MFWEILGNLGKFGKMYSGGENSKFYIYVLKCMNDKYYVGKTNNVERRYHEHLSGGGSIWTTKYRPLRIEKILETTSPFDEDKYTKQYMAIYGINNVRGGSYVSDYLPPDQLRLLKKEIWGAINACTRCGRKGHFYDTCVANTDICGDEINLEHAPKSQNAKFGVNYNNYYSYNPASRSSKSGGSGGQKCYKCGEAGHYANNCRK